MKKTGIVLGAITLAGLGAYLASGQVNAYRGDPAVKGPNYSEERHEAMLDAFENHDYQAWKELMDGRGRVSEVVTEDNFERFAEAHKLMLEGKTEEANQIRQELGLGQGQGYQGRSGHGMGFSQGR